MRLARSGVLFLSVAWAAACSSGAGGDERAESTGTLTAALVDTSVCPAGSNIIVGTAGDDVLAGTAGADCILGDAGNDTIQGLAGDDVLVGGEGDDVLEGGIGNDVLDGEDGNDQLDGGAGEDTLNGGAHNDLLDGGTGKDIVDGGGGNDVIVGENAKDTINGGDGDDVILGGNGQDGVSGGAGTDSCSGTGCENPESPIATCASDADCSSGFRCTQAGICVACLADAECDDGNSCTSESCSPTVGCSNPVLPDGTLCLDSTVCNGTETCAAGVCQPGTPLVCDDGQFCNGPEWCEAVQGCQPGTPPSLGDGVSCTVDTCNEALDVIEHAPSNALCDDAQYCNGAETCNAAFGCQNGVPPTIDDAISCTVDSCDEGADVVVHAPNDGLCSGDFICGPVGCQADCAPVTIYTGVERCVTLGPGDSEVAFRLNATDTNPWEQQYVQDDEPDVNYCGPTAVKNFLYWYGQDASYGTLADEMDTNSWDFPLVLGLVFLAGPAVGCFDPFISCPTVAGIISTALVDAGTLPSAMRDAMNARAPAGYDACMKDGDGNFDDIYGALSEGNPVVFLESRGTNNLHWAVATGLYMKDGDLWVRVANSADRSWSEFQTDWSLSQVGDAAFRDLLNVILGIKPYIMIRWVPEGSGC